MVKYRCECNYETHDITKIKRHLARVTPCISGKDMKLIDVKTLIVEPMLKNPVDLSNLTIEEKRERRLQQKIAITTKYRTCGNMKLEQFAKHLYNGMKVSSKQRNHEMELSLEDITEILRNTNSYTITGTILGDIEFPLQLTNGYHNTASFDRIDDNMGYSKENIEIRPFFLNTKNKLTTDMIRDIIELRQEKRNIDSIINIANDINNFDSNSFFYKLATSIISNTKKDNMKKSKKFLFKGNYDCALFLVKQFINQGGRCAYTNIPIYPDRNHVYKISPERINSNKDYSEDNIMLITTELNGMPLGQFCNKHLTDENREYALKMGQFNQEYWDNYTKITVKITEKCTELIDYEKKMFLLYLNDEMKQKLGY